MNPRRLLQAVRGEAPGETPRSRRTWGTVTAIAGNTVSVSIAGGDAVDGLRHFKGYTPTVGDLVVVWMNGSDWTVEDTLA